MKHVAPPEGLGVNGVRKLSRLNSCRVDGCWLSTAMMRISPCRIEQTQDETSLQNKQINRGLNRLAVRGVVGFGAQKESTT